MNEIFGEENKLSKWLLVWAKLAEAQAELDMIPKDAAVEIGKKADLNHVKLARVKQIESEIDHDLMAAVKALAEVCDGNAGGYVHMGATSYDIEDTATALRFGEAIDGIKERLVLLKKTCLAQMVKNKDIVCIGRTHGQHAVPMAFGLKFANWANDCYNNIERLEGCKKRILIGKLTGAVGTMATQGEKAKELQTILMKKLGLKPALVTTQVISRDNHAEVICILAIICADCERIAKEIRNLQRTEIMEVAEPFRKKQVGSSTMPHKRNPHKSERICSLARIPRADAQIALENISLEHERDLTNSANERVIFPQAFESTDYILTQMQQILEGLEIFPENIERNLKLTCGAVLAEHVMIMLAERGMSRQEAHELLREACIDSRKTGKRLPEILSKNLAVIQLIGEDELARAFDESAYIGKSKEIIADVLKTIS